MVEFTTYYREVKANKLIYKKDPEDIIGWHYDRRVNTHFVSARPNWWKVAAILVLIQPSSAACERVFSLLNNSFSNKQSKALADYIILSLMMQFNKRRVTPKISKTPEALESSRPPPWPNQEPTDEAVDRVSGARRHRRSRRVI